MTHDRGMVHDVTRQRLAACPGEGPEGRRQPDAVQFLFGFLPKRYGFIGEMQFDCGNERRTKEAGVGPNEGGVFGNLRHQEERAKNQDRSFRI